jgi:hypothetical protein
LCLPKKVFHYSRNNLLRETELKATLTGSTLQGKRQPAKESTTIENGKMLTLCSNLEVADGCDVGGGEIDDE